MRAYLTALVVLGLVACGSPGDERAATASNAETQPAFDPDYVVFADRAAADTWLTANEPSLLTSAGTTGLVASDARTVRVQTLIQKHWPTIVAKFAPNIPAPIAIVIDEPTVDAFTTMNADATQALDAVFVYTGILPLSDTDLETVLVHEMGHLVTKNLLPPYQAVIVKDYMASVAEQLGITMPNDPMAAGLIEPYIELANTIGGDSAPELDGLPTADGMFGDFLQAYADQHIDAGSSDCTDLVAQFENENAILDAARSSFDQSLALTAEQSSDLTTAVQAIEAESVTCMKPDPTVDLEAALDAAFNLPAGSFATELAADESLYAGKDAVTGLFAVVKARRAEMKAAETADTFPWLRQYSYEESADDFAMTILHAEGTSATELGQLNLDMYLLNGPTGAADQARCEGILASGALPPYSLTNPHHGNCYRAFHAKAFQKYLAAGGQGVQPTAPIPRGVTPAAALGPKRPRLPGRPVIID